MCWFVYSHQLYMTQSWILKMKQREILSSTYPVFHHSPWRLCIWSGQMPALTQPFLHSYNHEAHMVLTHPSRLLSSTCLPSDPVRATVPQFI